MADPTEPRGAPADAEYQSLAPVNRTHGLECGRAYCDTPGEGCDWSHDGGPGGPRNVARCRAAARAHVRATGHTVFIVVERTVTYGPAPEAPRG